MAEFPMAAVDVMHDRFKELLTDRDILDRPLRPTDPARSLGIYPVDWAPDVESLEIGGVEPTLGRYQYRIQTLVKASDEEEGRVLYAKDSKIVRAILYRDEELRVRLHAIAETTLGFTERFKRMGISRQRFLNNELQGTFIFLATTELWLDTESEPA